MLPTGVGSAKSRHGLGGAPESLAAASLLAASAPPGVASKGPAAAPSLPPRPLEVPASPPRGGLGAAREPVLTEGEGRPAPLSSSASSPAPRPQASALATRSPSGFQRCDGTRQRRPGRGLAATSLDARPGLGPRGAAIRRVR